MTNRYSDLFTRDEIHKIVETQVQRKDFEIKDYLIKPASETPLGFLGEHIKIIANIVIDGKDKTCNYFAKKIPTEVAAHLEYAQKTRAFYKEIEVYKTLFQDFRNAQKGVTGGRKWCPDYFYSRDWEVLVVEDLSVHGFYMYPERTLLDLDHMKAGLEVMAILHAQSFIFEEKYNEGKLGSVTGYQKKGDTRVTLGEMYEHLVFESEATDIKGHPGNTFCEVGFDSQVPLVDILPSYTDQEKRKIKEVLPAKMRRMLELVKPSKKYKNIFLHGDLWTNNLLFRKGTSGKVEQAILVDFQMARYSPPAHEIIMLIHLAQSKAFRDEHEKDLLDFYYKNFSEEVRKHGYDPEVLLPRAELQESYEDYYELGVVTCTSYFQLILLPSDIFARFLSTPELYHHNMFVDRAEMIKECYRNDEICRARITEAMNELIQKYILI